MSCQLKVSNLLEWAKKNGATIDDGIEFRNSLADGIGAYKTKSSFQYKISIPQELIISPAKASHHFKTAKNQRYSNNGLLKMYLAHLKFSHLGVGFYQPYIDSLPIGSSMPDSPLIWTSEQKKLLQGSNLGGSLGLKLVSLVHEWGEFVTDSQWYDYFRQLSLEKQLKHVESDEFESRTRKLAENGENILPEDFEGYLWAHLIMTSRSFPYSIVSPDSKAGEAVLLPIIDLLNHKPRHSVTWQFLDDRFVITSENDESSDEIFNNYGAKGNEELLLGYGFVLPDNELTSCPLRLKLPVDQIAELEKTYSGLQLMTEFDYSNLDTPSETQEKYRQGLLYYIRKDGVSEELIALFKALALNSYDSKYSFPSNRATLVGWSNLQLALEQKKKVSKENLIKTPESRHEIIAASLKQGEYEIYSRSVKQLKQGIKDTMKTLEAAGKLTTVKKILNSDTDFKQQYFSQDLDDESAVVKWMEASVNLPDYIAELLESNTPPQVLELVRYNRPGKDEVILVDNSKA